MVGSRSVWDRENPRQKAYERKVKIFDIVEGLYSKDRYIKEVRKFRKYKKISRKF